MRIVIIGGTGHIGSFLIPRLWNAGHEVIVVTRKRSVAYIAHPAWEKIEYVMLDRTELEMRGVFGQHILSLKPDIVVDLICFTPSGVQQIVKALKGSISHYLFCGTIWVYGHSVEVPTDEQMPRHPLRPYGIDKAAIEEFLLSQSKESGFPATILHPGHIVGPGWRPVNPAGNLDPEVFKKISRGEEVLIPTLGMETLHHVHADDVAQGFQLAIDNPHKAIGQSFNIVSPEAISFRGYAESMALWFGKKPNLKFLPYDEWKNFASEEDARITQDHLTHSPNCSIKKAIQVLGYKPGYTSLQAVQEALQASMKM